MKRYLPVLLMLGCGAALAFGLLQLFKLRFEAGDVYPPYSSLRSDPLGTMALYESLQKMPGVNARRDYSSTEQLPDGRDTTYVHLAANMFDWRQVPQDTFKAIEQFLARGGRLVIAFYPQSSTFRPFYLDREKPEKESGKDKEKDRNEPDKEQPQSVPVKPAKKKRSPVVDESIAVKTVSIQERWGVEFSVASLARGGRDTYASEGAHNASDLPLPETLEWHSGIVMTNLDKSWQTIYARGDRPVVIQRRFGHGSVVIATDCYLFSNEAMQKDRHADVLAWLVGANRTVVFDEAHLGVVETSGVVMLMRKYRLHGLAAGLAVLAILFIWKNSVSLIPREERDRTPDFVPGKEAAAGFVNLLRRHIAPRHLLETGFAEWRKSAAQSGKYSSIRVAHAEAIFQSQQSLPLKERNPVQTYQTISRILDTRNPQPGAGIDPAIGARL